EPARSTRAIARVRIVLGVIQRSPLVSSAPSQVALGSLDPLREQELACSDGDHHGNSAMPYHGRDSLLRRLSSCRIIGPLHDPLVLAPAFAIVPSPRPLQLRARRGRAAPPAPVPVGRAPGAAAATRSGASGSTPDT